MRKVEYAYLGMCASLGWSLDASYVADSSCLISSHVMGCLSRPIGNLIVSPYLFIFEGQVGFDVGTAYFCKA
jgi:hypothetical protein